MKITTHEQYTRVKSIVDELSSFFVERLDLKSNQSIKDYNELNQLCRAIEEYERKIQIV